MLFSQKPVRQKRADMRLALGSKKILRFPGAFSPLVSMLIEQIGFDGVFISRKAPSQISSIPHSQTLLWIDNLWYKLNPDHKLKDLI